MRDDHPVALRCQNRGDVNVTVNVVGPTVEQDDGGSIGWAGFGVSNIQETGVDLLERAERCVRACFARRRYCSAGVRVP
jgi:hypothetical protein